MRKFTVVALDESEGFDPSLVERAGGSIHVLYAFDPEEKTECQPSPLCEQAPGYRLVPFDVVPNFTPDDPTEHEHKHWPDLHHRHSHGDDEERGPSNKPDAGDGK